MNIVKVTDSYLSFEVSVSHLFYQIPNRLVFYNSESQDNKIMVTKMAIGTEDPKRSIYLVYIIKLAV